MSQPPKIVRVNDVANAWTLVAIAGSILLLYTLSRIISLQRRVRDLEARPPVDDIVMRGMVRQQVSEVLANYERRKALEIKEPKVDEVKTAVKTDVKTEAKTEAKTDVKEEVKAEVKEGEEPKDHVEVAIEEHETPKRSRSQSVRAASCVNRTN
jgi:hypothetical protein